MNNGQTPNIDEGSINFWIKPHQVDFNNGKANPLVQVNPKGGSILIVKDSDNFLKFFHVFIGKGRTDVMCDVSNLSPVEPHMITATWSVSTSEIKLYIDGKIRAERTIDYK